VHGQVHAVQGVHGQVHAVYGGVRHRVHCKVHDVHAETDLAQGPPAFPGRSASSGPVLDSPRLNERSQVLLMGVPDRRFSTCPLPPPKTSFAELASWQRERHGMSALPMIIEGVATRVMRKPAGSEPSFRGCSRLQPGDCHIWTKMRGQPDTVSDSDSMQWKKQIECILRAEEIFTVTPLPSAAARQERWDAMRSWTQLSAPLAPDKHNFSHILYGVPHG
jgi:hypothetical protein